MSTAVKIVAGTVAGAGLIAGYSYFRNMKRASVQLEVIPKAYIHSLDFSALKIRVDALLKNPTRAAFKIKFPYIRLMYKDSLLGSSQVVNKDISIASFGQVVVDGMMVEIPVVSLLSSTYKVIKAMSGKDGVKLTGAVITTIDLGWSRIPYESKMEIVLKNGSDKKTTDQ